eukprot:TRINITY_DN13429_c0_g1_i1.p1 TRINITY_DN13429_c0_g1~~TRINITY_DN13429_c0_g1_i1.p1  ORF type:complete len:161 (-),score=15.23 TRINITY_DN13429_c0_g1_i1:4-486(-)
MSHLLTQFFSFFFLFLLFFFYSLFQHRFSFFFFFFFFFFFAHNHVKFESPQNYPIAYTFSLTRAQILSFNIQSFFSVRIYYFFSSRPVFSIFLICCLLYTSDAADDMQCVDLGGRRILQKKNKNTQQQNKATQQHKTPPTHQHAHQTHTHIHPTHTPQPD